MPTVTPSSADSEPAAAINSRAASSVEQLIQRVTKEIDAAERRVQSLQSEAANVMLGQAQGLQKFVTIADRIHAILCPRLKAMMSFSVFEDITQSVSMEGREPNGDGFHGRTTTLSVPSSDKRPTPMELSFRVGHDDPVESVVMDYRLEILPIYLKFDRQQQLVIPVNNPNEEIIATWIDDKLIGFTTTYFEVYFNSEYQKKSLETDPVLKIRFPRAFAAGKAKFQNQTFHFYTEQSQQLFELDPSNYFTPG